MAVHVEATSWCRSCSVVRAVKNEPLRIDTFGVRERTQGERLTSECMQSRDAAYCEGRQDRATGDAHLSNELDLDHVEIVRKLPKARGKRVL
jgi:hypothetical protein